MSEGYDGPQWQLYRFDKLYPYRYHRNLPEWMKKHICMCQKNGGFDFEGKGRYYPTCAVCKKLKIYLVHKCSGCGEIFLKCFRHTNYCPAPRCVLCWDCVQKSEPCTIDFHERKVPWDREVSPPLYKAPRKFTKEELDNFDIFA